MAKDMRESERNDMGQELMSRKKIARCPGVAQEKLFFVSHGATMDADPMGTKITLMRATSIIQKAFAAEKGRCDRSEAPSQKPAGTKLLSVKLFSVNTQVNERQQNFSFRKLLHLGGVSFQLVCSLSLSLKRNSLE